MIHKTVLYHDTVGKDDFMSAIKPPTSFTGNGPFVFVSYSHKDTDQVYPDIAAMQRAGISVW